MTAQDNQLLSSVRTAESCQTLRNFPNTSGTFQIWSELNHAAMQLLPKCSMEPFERGATFQNLKMQNLCKTNYFRNFAIPPERPAAFSYAAFLSNFPQQYFWLHGLATVISAIPMLGVGCTAGSIPTAGVDSASAWNNSLQKVCGGYFAFEGKFVFGQILFKKRLREGLVLRPTPTQV